MRRALVIAVAAFLLAANTSALAGTLDLTILHTNDEHGRLAATPSFGSICTPEHKAENKCRGGAARLAGAISAVRTAGGNVLLLDAGDQFQGTLFYTHYKGQAAAQVMNRLGYDAMAVGNHEFDDGPVVLARFAKRIKFPLLSSNTDISADTHLAGLVAPWAVIERGGERVGVIGLTTEETPNISSPGPDIRFSKVARALKDVVASIEKMGINKIIALGHVGYGRDMEMARTINGIDIIVGGHSKTAPGNATCRTGECALGNLIADIMLWRTAGEGSEIAIANGGGIRAGLPAGAVTRGDVLQVLPFGNTLATFGLHGRDLLRALEHGLTRNGSGAFPQVAGLSYSWGATRPAGERLGRVTVRGADGIFALLDEARIYRLVSNNFLSRGGGGYDVLRDHAIDAYDFGPVLADAAIAYLGEHAPIAPRLEGRIKQLQ